MFVGNVIGGRRGYVAPEFCPPNLLLAGAIVYEWASCQVAKGVWELNLLLGSLICGEERRFGVVAYAQVSEGVKEDSDSKSEFVSACVS